MFVLFLSVQPYPLLSFVTTPGQPGRPWAHHRLGSASPQPQAKPQVTYSESVLTAADDQGFLSLAEVCQLLADHGTSWDDFSEWLGDRNSQTPQLAESVLAFLGY